MKDQLRLKTSEIEMSATILSGFYDIDMLYKVILNFKLLFSTQLKFGKGPKTLLTTLARALATASLNTCKIFSTVRKAHCI